MSRVETIYEQYDAAGVLTRKVTGAAMRSVATKDSDVIYVNASSLGGLKPTKGDCLRDANGNWWVVWEALPLTGGEFPLRVKEGQRTA